MCAAMTKKVKIQKYRAETGLTPFWTTEIEEYLESFTEKETLMLLFYLEAAAGREMLIPEARKGVQATAYKARSRVMEELKVGIQPPRELVNAVMAVAPKILPEGLLFAAKAYHGSGWEKRGVVVNRADGQGVGTVPVASGSTPNPTPNTNMVSVTAKDGTTVRFLAPKSPLPQSELDGIAAKVSGMKNHSEPELQREPGDMLKPVDFMKEMNARSRTAYTHLSPPKVEKGEELDNGEVKGTDWDFTAT